MRAATAAPGATDPALGARFTDEQVARHGAYRAPAYLALGLGIALEIGALVVLARGPIAAASERLARVPGGVAVRAALVGALVAVVLALVHLPVAYVRGYVMEHAWGLSTQDVGGWLSDRARAAAVSAVVAAVAAGSFFAIVRWQPRTWWLWGWGAFTVLGAMFVVLWPVAVAPLFNRFTTLDDAALARGIRALAAEAGVDVDRVLVADASRRTTAENAYVAGLLGTTRVVVYDTLVARGDPRDTLFVVAHELGHYKERHVAKNLAIASAGLFVGFAVLAALGGRAQPWAWGGATGIGDVRALPVLLLFATVAGLFALPVQSAVSRAFERRADELAVGLTRDPDAAVRSFRRLAFSNLADLRPPRVLVWLVYSHPPIPDRIEAVSSPRPHGTPP